MIQFAQTHHPLGSADPVHLTKVGSSIYFFAKDQLRGIKLMKLDHHGTITTVLTLPVGSTPMNALPGGNGLVYTLRDADFIYTLYHSNGTAAGTRAIKPAANSAVESNGQPPRLAVTANGFYFSADYTTTSHKVWKIPLNP